MLIGRDANFILERLLLGIHCKVNKVFATIYHINCNDLNQKTA